MKRFITILVTVTGYLCHAQDFSYKQFTTEDGLSSNVVYSAFQDRQGYIWFCTDAGVSRFDGIRFQNYTTKDGLSDNEVFKAAQTRAGKILFVTFNGKICYYDNGVIHNAKTDVWLREPFPASGALYQDKGGVFWGRPDVDSVIYTFNENEKRISQFPAISGDSMTIITNEGIDTVCLREKAILAGKITQFTTRYKQVIQSFQDIRSFRAFFGDYLEYLRYEHPSIPLPHLRYIFDGHSNPRFRFAEFSYPAADDRIWLAHGNNGIVSCKYPFNPHEKPVAYLQKKNVSHFMIDKEGNYWFTSSGEGVFFLSAHDIRNYRSGSDTPEVYSVTGNRTHIIAGKNNEIFMLNKTTAKKITFKINDITPGAIYNRVKDLLLQEQKLWIACDISCSIFDLSQNEEPRDLSLVYPPLSASAVKCFSKGANGRIYIGTHSKLLAADNRHRFSALADKRITAVVEISPDSLLIGSTDGLHVYSYGRTNLFSNAPMLNQRITDIEKIKDGWACVAIGEAGLILLKGRQYFPITAADNVPLHQRLAGDICRKIFVDDLKNIWVCTNQGLCCVTITSWAPLRYSIQRFTADDGLLSNDVNDVYVSNDTVWVGTMGGLNMFRKDRIKQRGSLPLIYISNSDSLNERSFRFGTKITIRLQGISYESLGKVRYLYKLTNLNTEWQRTDKHDIYYEILPPGNYMLQVYAINRFGQLSVAPAKLSFTVLPPWWQTRWAYLCYVIGFASVMSGTIFSVKRNLRLKEITRTKHREQLMQLELKALRAQMNPHFIFNTLNTIQKYILENDTEASYRYLSKFSRLIRSFLETSHQASITLQQELELLRSYMEMEALRFRNKFSYEIRVDQALEASLINIPSMLIQPYVENAIWHGIQHKSGSGMICISVSHVKDGVLKCSIEDNGIGRRKAKEVEAQSDTQHHSVGMTITRQRLELINQKLRDGVSVNLIDLAENDPDCSGTIVELTITYPIWK